MKSAISLYLGGTTIDAASANYDSSIDLGLRCPFCGKPVFLVGEAVRQRRDKLEYISPHFSHYKAEATAGKVCEARALTKEGREYLQKLQPEARGQRLGLYNRRLWDMLMAEKDAPRDCKKWLKRHAPQLLPKTTEMVEHCRKHWRDPEERSRIKAAMPGLVQHLTPEKIAASIGAQPNAEVEAIAQTWQQDLSKRLHWAICNEVADYLAQPEAAAVFEKLVYLAMFDRLTFHPGRNEPIHSNQIMEICMGSIALTRWEAMLERFSKARRGDGFG